MASVIRIWYDREGDLLEITFREAKGYLREVREDVYERVDEAGDLLGYVILNMSRHERQIVTIPVDMGRLRPAAEHPTSP